MSQPPDGGPIAVAEVSDAGLRTLVECHGDGMLVLDPSGVILYANPAATRLLGRTADELRDTMFGLPLDAADGGEIDLNTGSEARVVELRTAPIRWDERVAVLATLHDVTDRHRAELALRDAHRTLEAVISAAPVAIVRLDADSRVLAWNLAAAEMFGWSEAELLGQLCPLPLVDATATETQLDRELTHRDGRSIVVAASVAEVHDDVGELESVVVAATDVTERLQREDQIRLLATHDQLTGLLNRRAFEEALERVVNRARHDAEQRCVGAMLLIDLDRFKAVNDTAGHLAGDELLIGVARLLEQGVRPGEVVARFGGDEFAVLINGPDPIAAGSAADRLRAQIAAFSLSVDGHGYSTTATVGGAVIDGRLDASELVAVADLAMHSAKDERRNSTLVHEHAEAKALELALTARRARAVRQAIDGGRFVIEHQPLVSLGTGQIAGYEALIRLPDGDELWPPDEFLPVADRIGAMWEIDRWMTAAALEALGDPTHPPVWVNLRHTSLAHPAILEIVAAAPGDARRRLGFEVPEQALAADLARARAWFGQLRALGCRLALDDFGTRSAAFGSLRLLPVDLVKIDREFIAALDQVVADRNLVRALVEFCAGLGIDVVAEGVENELVRDVAEGLGVAYGQGFLWPPRDGQP